jgi:Tol biopolymer transport system component/tetratricopeptide (TPR) repeat protein
MGRSCLIVVGCLIFGNCVLFQKSVKIQPIPFDYEAIGKNYFSPKSDKPFPLTIQRGNNLYNSTTKDGKYLFYSTNKDGNFDIWFRDLSSSIVVPITEHPSQEYKPAISPDGQRLVFVSEQYDSEGDLLLLDLDPEEWVEGLLKGKRFLNKKFRNLTNPDWDNPAKQQRVIDTDPIWLPDNRRIVYSTDRFSPGLQNLVVLDVEDKNRMSQLTYNGGTSPFPSQDGTSVYFLSYRDTPSGDIYKVELETGKIQRITADSYLNFSPSVSKDERYLYYTSIRKDTNRNGKLDERDNSYIVQLDLKSKRENLLSSGDTSIFDTKYSNFNGGSILFSASFFNSINVYFIPYNGSIPKQDKILDQFEYALKYKNSKKQSQFYLALDSVELYFETDPLYPIFEARILAEKAIASRETKNNSESAAYLQRLNSLSGKNRIYGQALARFYEPGSFSSGSRAYFSTWLKNEIEAAERGLKSGSGKPTGPGLGLSSGNSEKNDVSELIPALMHLLADHFRRIGEPKSELSWLQRIEKEYPSYHLIRDIRSRASSFQFYPESESLPSYYHSFLCRYEDKIRNNQTIEKTEKVELREILDDIRTKILSGRNPDQVLQHVPILEKGNRNTEKSEILRFYLLWIRAEALRNKKDFAGSAKLLDAQIPIPGDRELDPQGQKSIFELPEFIQIYKNPGLSYVHLSRYRTAQTMGNSSVALRNLRIFMEFYDPILSPELEEEEFSKLFLYWENKAVEFERIGDLQQAAIHYYFNNLGMSLAKSKNINVDRFYGNYAVYYQRKMLDTIFRHGRELRKKEEDELLNRLNILGEGKLNVLGNLSGLMALVQKIPLAEALKIAGDFRDLQNKDALHENALLLADLYFNYHLEKNRPYLNHAVAYGHAYYLINRAVINEAYLYETDGMTENKKRQILEAYKKAEYELKWIIFSDPTFPDAYQLLGWLYQYIDIIKSKKIAGSESTEEEKFGSLYASYFPEKNFEENVELYTQILEFLGQEYPNKMVLSDLNLNLGNNYFLLNNFVRANEAGLQVENYGNYILESSQFESYRQEAVFRYNFGRTALYRGNLRKAIEQFQQALEIYRGQEYYQSMIRLNESLGPETGLGSGSQNSLPEYKEVKGKLALLYALIGLSYMELGEFEEAIPPLQSALSHNRASENINSINLWNALAIAYQKTGRFRESYEILDKADQDYQTQKDSEPWIRLSWPAFKDWLWSFALNDSIRVNGEGRFPGEFPLDFKQLLTQSIRVNNYIEQSEHKKALLALEDRDRFIRKMGLEKWVMGKIVQRQSNVMRGQILYDSEEYEDAFATYTRLLDLSPDSGLSSSNQQILRRRSHSAFAKMEKGLDKEDEGILAQNLKDLLEIRSRYIDICAEELGRDICLAQFRKEFSGFDHLVGLNYFYLGEWNLKFTSGEEAVFYFGKALEYLKNPGGLDSKDYFLKTDVLNRRERIRSQGNLARVYLRLGDLEEANRLIVSVRELSSEFQLEREGFQALLLENELKSFLVRAKSGQNQLTSLAANTREIQNRFQNQETLFWSLPSHSLEEVYETSIRTAFFQGRFHLIPDLRDQRRNALRAREILQAGLEFEDLRLDGSFKSFRRSVRSLLRARSELERRALAREPVLDQTKRSVLIKSTIADLRKRIGKEFPRYLDFITYKLDPQPINSVTLPFLRCFDSGDRMIFWSGSPGQSPKQVIVSKFENPPISMKTLILENQILPLGSDTQGIHWNPDNCNNWKPKDLTSLTTGGRPVFLFTKQKDLVLDSELKFLPWRNRAVLKTERLDPSLAHLNPIDSEKLGPRLFDSDFIVVPNQPSTRVDGGFSYQGSGKLNLREIFSQESKISAIYWVEKEWNPDVWEKYSKTWDFVSVHPRKRLFFGSDSYLSSGTDINLNSLPKDLVVFGPIPQTRIATVSKESYSNFLNQGIELERSRDYIRAYDKYFDADAYLDKKSESGPEILNLQIRLARMKRKIFSEYLPDYFYKPIWEKLEKDPGMRDEIRIAYLIDCFSDRQIKAARSGCEKDYLSWSGQSSKIQKSVYFYFKMYKGEIRDLETVSPNWNRNSYIDEFTFLMNLSDLYLENFLFLESLKYAKAAGNLTINSRERGIVQARNLEVDYHRAYLEGRTEFSYRTIPAQTTYALGFTRDWEKYTEKIYSESFRKLGDSDSIYDEYRKKLYEKWKDKEFGRDFEPIILIPDELYEGGSVLAKMTHLNRSLYFYLLQNSANLQLGSEADLLLDRLLEEEWKEGFKSRAFAYALFYADASLRSGQMKSAKRAIRFFEKNYSADKSFHPFLEKAYIYLNFKISRYDESTVFLKNTESFLDSEQKFLVRTFRKIKSEGPDEFANILNEYVRRKGSNTPFTDRDRAFLEDLIQYMHQVSLEFDSTDGFLDSVHFLQTLKSTTEQSLGSKPRYGDLPIFQLISKSLIQKIPRNQEISVVVDFMGKTYVISLEQTGTKGRELFPENLSVRSNFRNYQRNLREGIENVRLREGLEEKYRLGLRLRKDRTHYVYLTGYHAQIPFSQRQDFPVYLIGNLEALARNPVLTSGEIAFSDPKIQIFSSGGKDPEDWRVHIRDLESWELNRISKNNGRNVSVGQDLILVSPNGALVFGEIPMARLGRNMGTRGPIWVQTSPRLGSEYYFSSLINQTLFYLDRIYSGVGVVSMEDQPEFSNGYFMRNLLGSKGLDLELRFRFQDARETLRDRYPQEKYWRSYRVITNRFIIDRGR